MNYPVPFYITCCTIVLLVIMGIYIAMAKNKKILHYIFLMIIFLISIWNGAAILRGIFGYNENYFRIFENITYIGAANVPVTLIFLGIAYAQSDKGLRKRHLFLLIIPCITQIIVWTNGTYHELFYSGFKLNSNGMYAIGSLGVYAYINIAYTYICTVIGLGYLSYFAIKNSGVWSAQAILIIIGSVIPLVTNICYLLNVPGFDEYSTPIAFTATLGLYLIGMFRFNLLRITPVALQTVINRISDSFIVVDTEMNIIEFNKSFEDNFKIIPDLQKGQNFYNILLEAQLKTRGNRSTLDAVQLRDIILSAAEINDTLVTDFELQTGDKKQYYTAEFTPLQQRSRNTAVVVLVKNVTQHIKDMQQIQDNQTILLERERLASLGQLIGGIAHNLKTPIMSVAGGIDQVNYLTEEYEASIDDPEVTIEDHKEIAAEIQGWLKKMKGHMGYMSDIISTVKDQAANFANEGQEWFTLDEVLKRVKILMQHEITKNHCRYTEDVKADRNIRVRGGLNSLVQILDNIIVNAVQAYGKKGGEIILQVAEERNMLQIVISDFGKGIKDDVKNRLFKEMVTTKGKNGTGLGLYMSHSTIKGMFRGDMWVESSEGVGTDFYIQLPILEETAEDYEDQEEEANKYKKEFADELTAEVKQNA